MGFSVSLSLCLEDHRGSSLDFRTLDASLFSLSRECRKARAQSIDSLRIHSSPSFRALNVISLSLSVLKTSTGAQQTVRANTATTPPGFKSGRKSFRDAHPQQQQQQQGHKSPDGKSAATSPARKKSNATTTTQEREEEQFDPSLVSPQLAMIKKLSVKPKSALLAEEEEKMDPTSPLALCNDGQMSESQSSGSADQDSVSFQEKNVSVDANVGDASSAAATGKKNAKGEKKKEEENYVKPRPIWVARLPRPASEKYDDSKAQRERDQVLDEKIKGLTSEIDAKIKESQELKVELDAKRVELKKSREEVKMANDLVKPIRDRWNGLRDAERSLKEQSQTMKGLDSVAKLEAKLDDLEKKMEDESLSVLEQNKILREQKKLRKMQTEIESLEEKKRQTTGPNLVGESRDELKARMNACSEAIDVLKSRLKTVSDSHDETFEQIKAVSETITSLRDKRSKFMKERSTKYNELAGVRKEIQDFTKFRSLARDAQASMNSKDVDVVSEARMKCEDHNDKLIARMIESEMYREWYMVETRREQSAARERKMEAQAVKDAEKLAKIEAKLKREEEEKKKKEKKKKEEEMKKEEEEVVPAAIPNSEKPASSSSSVSSENVVEKKLNKKQNQKGAKKSNLIVDAASKNEVKEEVPKIAEVPEHILEILSTKNNSDGEASDPQLSPRSQAREKSLEGAQLKARKQQLKQERLKANAQKAEKNSASLKSKSEESAAASAALQAARAQMELELQRKQREEQERLSFASKDIQVDKEVVKVAAKAAKRAALMKEMKKERRDKMKKILLAIFVCIVVSLLTYSHFTTKPEPKVINVNTNSWSEEQNEAQQPYHFEEDGEAEEEESLFNSEL
jgi:uncharacterized coiled-coil DUF342 family protein